MTTAWAVSGKHVGCYTGGKIGFCESSNILGCLCSEELHLVDAACQAPTRVVSQEGDGVLTFAIDRLGLHACTSHRSGLLRHFSLGEKVDLVRSWRGHDQVVADVCFDTTGALVATGSVDQTAKVWDFQGYFCTHNFKGHAGIVTLVRFHPARLQLVTVANTEVRLWDLESSVCVAVLKDHLSSISSMCFGPVRSKLYQLVTGGRDQVVNVWNLEEKCSLVRSIPVFENVEGVVAIPTKRLRQQCKEAHSDCGPFSAWLREEDAQPAPFVIFTVGNKGVVRAWNPLDGKAVASHDSPHAAKGELRQIHCLDTSGGTKMVTVGEDMNLMIWTLPEFEVSSHIMGHNEEIVHVQLIPQITWPEEQPDGSGTAPEIVAERFVCIANDEHPRVVTCEGFGASLLRGHTDVVISCDVSPDGAWIATGGKDQSIRIWSSSTCQFACICAGHAGDVSALSFAKRRPRSVRAASQQVIAHSKEVNDVLALASQVCAGTQVLVSPNNKLIASGGQDKLVRIWKFPEGDLLGAKDTGEVSGALATVEQHLDLLSSRYRCVAFSPIDQVVASASAIRSFQGHSSAVLRVAFLANGMQLMSSSVDGLLKLWHIRTAECAATLEEHTSKVWCIDILGDRMVSGGADSKICVWRDSTLEVEKQRFSLGVALGQDEKADLAIKDSRIGLLVREGKVVADRAAVRAEPSLAAPVQGGKVKGSIVELFEWSDCLKWRRVVDSKTWLSGWMLLDHPQHGPLLRPSSLPFQVKPLEPLCRQKRGMQRGRKGDRQKSSKGNQAMGNCVGKLPFFGGHSKMMLADEALRSRARGCMLGIMVGDALGAAFEGYSQERIRKLAQGEWRTPLVQGFIRAVHMGTYISTGKTLQGPFQLARGVDDMAFVPPGIELPQEVLDQCGRIGMYTDDTCACLAVAGSLVECGKADAGHVARSCAEFFRDNEHFRGSPPTAKQVNAACLAGVAVEKTGLPPYFRFEGGSFANGGAMRISPLALAYRHASPETLRNAVEQTILGTHRHTEAVDFAVLQAAAVQYSLLHDPGTFNPNELLPGLLGLCHSDDMRDVMKSLARAVRFVNMDDADDQKILGPILNKHKRPGSGLGFQLASIHMAPCVFWLVSRHYRDPRCAVQAAVDLGGDTDTTASMVGAIVGALHGEGWCDDWAGSMENGIHGRDYALRLAEQLVELDLEE
ncbi:Tbl3 [Symbiodinium sp. CCMP2456]|nr:Tbl3 [Symbiodinium sp. CCMP2456]